jgi:hypothetical protein
MVPAVLAVPLLNGKHNKMMMMMVVVMIGVY